MPIEKTLKPFYPHCHKNLTSLFDCLGLNALLKDNLKKTPEVDPIHTLKQTINPLFAKLNQSPNFRVDDGQAERRLQARINTAYQKADLHAPPKLDVFALRQILSESLLWCATLSDHYSDNPSDFCFSKLNPHSPRFYFSKGQTKQALSLDPFLRYHALQFEEEEAKTMALKRIFPEPLRWLIPPENRDESLSRLSNLPRKAPTVDRYQALFNLSHRAVIAKCLDTLAEEMALLSDHTQLAEMKLSKGVF